MSIALASTWLPRGEMVRFQRLHPFLLTVFDSITLVMPPEEADLAAMASQMPHVRAIASESWARGRNASLRFALESDSSHLLYSDFDRVLHWSEIYPNEFAETVSRIDSSECLVIGRTPRALATHPNCLQETEQIINDVYAHITGNRFDICVAARGLSRTAVMRILDESRVATALGVDGEWLYILQRAGYPLEYIEVDGMDWETADQYLPHAADADTQRSTAEAYDTQVANWSQRIYVAQQIINALLDISKPTV